MVWLAQMASFGVWICYTGFQFYFWVEGNSVTDGGGWLCTGYAFKKDHSDRESAAFVRRLCSCIYMCAGVLQRSRRASVTAPAVVAADSVGSHARRARA
jgi:hypothetical protein